MPGSDIPTTRHSANPRLRQGAAWLFVLVVGWFWWRSLRGLPLAAGLAQVRGREGYLLLSLGCALLYLVGQAAVWRGIVADLLGVPLPWRRALRVWMLSNMGRYLPGSVWHLVGRVVAGQGEGVTRQQGTLAVFLEQALQLLSALLLVSLSLPGWPEGSAVRGWAWLAALVPLGLLALHPRLFFPLANRVLLRVGREPLPSMPRYRTLLGYLLRYTVVHLANGMALAAALLALGAPLRLVPAALGAALAAWSVGFVTILAPGGLGVREWLVTAALAPLVGADIAALAALLWRAANLLTEAGGAIGFGWWGRESSR